MLLVSVGSRGSLVSQAGLAQLAERLRDRASLPFGRDVQIEKGFRKAERLVNCYYADDVSGLLGKMLNSMKKGLSPISLVPQELRVRTLEDCSVRLPWAG